MTEKRDIEKLVEANKAFMDLTVKIINKQYEPHELIIWNSVAKNTSNYINRIRKDLKPVIDELISNPN
tara:strand:+ start:282 stop:485 length:204 start_codon:yes stop_codon:yes gene_type:complete